MAYPNLSAERARNGLSVCDIAKAAGVSDKTVYNWLNGVSRPDIQQAMDINRKLFPTCELSYLFAN